MAPAIFITAPKQKPLVQLSDPELADLFGDAALKVEQREYAEKKRDQFRNELQRRHAAAEATEDQFVEGLRWAVRLSARRNETTLTNRWAVYLALGVNNVEEFVDLVMGLVPLWFLEEKLGKSSLEGLVTVAPTGYRTVRAVQQPIEPGRIELLEAA